MNNRNRMAIAVTGVVALATTAVLYVGLAARDRDPVAFGAAGVVSLTPGPRLLFRGTADADRGHLVTVSQADPGGPRAVSQVSCTRVHAAGGTGICLYTNDDLTTSLTVLDERLEKKREVPLFGVASRARVSPTGRMVTWTVFAVGDSYNLGVFSTRVGILDTATGEVTNTLEDYAVTMNGRPYGAADLHFWGATFAKDGNRFFATMSTGGHRYLVEGDFAARSVRTVRENVECPSLSPDGTRIAFKSAIDGDPARGWRLSVLDLSTSVVTPLAETRSVDDQAAWIDDHTVAYAIPRGVGRSDVWSVPADGSGTPHLLIPDGESPAVLG
ncbi:PD40 domain-containing protein [Amycolatopsis decaplanina]|uniref:TolB-like translocation protein n=1 Tax=Amycolatopsis decaplanina DSM 44594 TaxID=1284240 RepID=M2YIS6_9PSEU|nr:PD40 domain-containing protein [Amycolatopsis decaplanina]EME61685.1 hypothetical protein H074_10950 [Amycolatopsis decaplanina DSM 44594]